MPLLFPVKGGRISQMFGTPASSVIKLEPAMYASGQTKAYWRSFPGGKYYAHYHPGVDIAANAGTPILAGEAGKVIQAGFSNSTDGNRVEVEIRPGVSYGHNHMQSLAPGVRLGAHVKRGQPLGYIGTTGATTGPHTHYFVQLLESGSDRVQRTMIYNPMLFNEGGAYAADGRILPVGVQPQEADDVKLPGKFIDHVINQRTKVATAGANFRSSPVLVDGLILATYPRGTGFLPTIRVAGDAAGGKTPNEWLGGWLWVNTKGWNYGYMHTSTLEPLTDVVASEGVPADKYEDDVRAARLDGAEKVLAAGQRALDRLS